jgi:hypothetical protein
MGISIRSILFVGARSTDIHCSREVLDNEIPEGMTEEEAEDLPYIERISPYYDADSRDCYYGIEVTCNEITEPGGLEMVDQLIVQLNELFKTSKCKLMHSPYVT